MLRKILLAVVSYVKANKPGLKDIRGVNDRKPERTQKFLRSAIGRVNVRDRGVGHRSGTFYGSEEGADGGALFLEQTHPALSASKCDQLTDGLQSFAIFGTV